MQNISLTVKKDQEDFQYITLTIVFQRNIRYGGKPARSQIEICGFAIWPLR